MLNETLMGRHRIIFLVLLSIIIPFLSFASIEGNVPRLKKYITKKQPGISIKTAEKIAVNVDKLSKKHNVDFSLVVGLIETESSFNPKARSSGNIGLMQVSYPVWKRHFGIKNRDELHRIEYNIDTGLKILNRYVRKSNGDVKKALRLYSGCSSNKSYVQKVFRNKNKFESYRRNA